MRDFALGRRDRSLLHKNYPSMIDVLADKLMIEQIILVLLCLFAILVISLNLYFRSKVLATERLRSQYLNMLDVLSNDHENLRNYDRLAAIEKESVKLFKQAKVYFPGAIISREPMPFGDLGPRPSEVKTNLGLFQNSIGYFGARRNETRSMVYWIESLINWPKSVLALLGFDRNGSFANVIQLILWIVQIVSGFTFVVTTLK